MRFSTLFNRLLKGSVAVEVYRRKENSEDGEMQGELCGVYSYGGRVPREIWSSYVARIWPLDIYDEIIEGTKALDDNDVPDTGRILTVVPDVYRMMKKNTELNIDCDITAEQRAKGVIAMVDGMDVIKMTAKKMPERAGFMISHPVATVAPTKLEDYKIHQDPPGISGELVEGRIVYDAFVLDNKKMAIYYVENKATE